MTEYRRHVVDFPTAAVRIDGAFDVATADPEGVVVRRMPAWTREQMPDAATDLVMGANCGIRLAMRTAATSVTVRMHTTSLQLPDDDSLLTQVLDLVVDGRHSARVPFRVDARIVVAEDMSVSVVDDGPSAVTVDGLADREKDVEIWLPSGASARLIALESDAVVAPPGADHRRRWLHHGSSISQGLEAGGVVSSWPVRVALERGLAIEDWSFAGNAMLDPFVARAIATTPADLISLELGMNTHNGATMTARTFGPAVHGFLDTIRGGHPDTPITVISPTAFPVGEGIPGPIDVRGRVPRPRPAPAEETPGALTLDDIRETLRDIVTRRCVTDSNLDLVDGRELIGLDEEHLLVDGLHPGAEGHAQVARRFSALWSAPGADDRDRIVS